MSSAAINRRISISREEIDRYREMIDNGIMPGISDEEIDQEVVVLDKIAATHLDMTKAVMPLVVEWLRLKRSKRQLLH